jgi:hypothetical protein
MDPNAVYVIAVIVILHVVSSSIALSRWFSEPPAAW